MSSIARRRNPTQQMHSLFHHSLIKMMVLHQLEQQGIPWDVFITHEDFTNAQPPHQPNLPSSSSQVPSPHANLPSSPSLGASGEEGSGDEESHKDQGESDDKSAHNEGKFDDYVDNQEGHDNTDYMETYEGNNYEQEDDSGDNEINEAET